MRIRVKLYAGLDAYLPDDAADNTFGLDADGQTTVNDIIELAKLPGEKVHLVLLNGVYVDPAGRDKRGIFSDGDTLALWPPVAGG